MLLITSWCAICSHAHEALHTMVVITLLSLIVIFQFIKCFNLSCLLMKVLCFFLW